MNYLLHPDAFSGRKGDMQFGIACEQWMQLKERSLKKSTIAKYRSILDKHIRPALGIYRIRECTSKLLAKFSDDLYCQKHLSEKTIRDILNVVHEILIFIQENLENQLPSVRITYPKIQKQELRVLSPEEQQRLTEYLLKDIDIYKFAVLLSLLTGLRIGEICGLRWENISLETKVLSVTCTVQRIRNPDRYASPKTILYLGTPKTSTSKRTIPFSDGLAQIFQFFQKNHSPDSFLLTGNEKITEPRTLQRKLKKYTEELGMKDIHFHTLRHTFATRCVELGCDIKTLSEILGHSNIATTMNRYVHPSLEMKRKHMEKLEQAGLSAPSKDTSAQSVEHRNHQSVSTCVAE